MSNPFEPINARLSNLEALTLEVLQYLRTNSAPPPADEFLDVKSSADFLGCTEQTVYQYKAKGILKAYKRMGRLKFKRSELISFLEAGATKRG